MRELNASATGDMSGADLLRFAHARKCNAAAAVQVTCDLRGIAHASPSLSEDASCFL
jgi:hypothetical protein